jgi:hypothetical protein
VGDDDFDRWALERDAREDQSVAARYVPLDVVGASQLDAYGSWIQDPGYGVVWYPRPVAVDWAPYRYGRWQWIKPWGWTWIDNAPWGFAPFHYGRWALIGSRWAWVPGRLGPRPVYAPALVAFVGGGASGPLPLGSGQGIAWYPLAPGEVWRPFFAATPAYVRRVNQSLAGAPVHEDGHSHRTRLNAITALRVEDFRSGQPVQRRWERPNPADLARAQPLLPPPALPARAANAAPRVMPAHPAPAAAPPNALSVPRQPNVASPPVPRPRVFDAPPGRYPVPVGPEQARTRAQQEQPLPHQAMPPRASTAQPLGAPPPVTPITTAPTNAPATRRDRGERPPQQEGPRHQQRPSGEQQDDGARRRQDARVN